MPGAFHSANRVKAPVDEFYINRVQVGQMADVDLGDTTYSLMVIKIYPEVEGGRFEVDLEFDGEAPADIRRGQTMRMRLALGNLSEAVLLSRGGFFQSTGGRWAYIISADGSISRLAMMRRSESSIWPSWTTCKAESFWNDNVNSSS